MKKLIKKNKKGYSILEVLITLALIGIVMVMLTNILFMSIDISRKALSRSKLREQQNNLLSFIQKDIRNSNFVSTCEGTNASAECTVSLDKIYTWGGCLDEGNNLYVCKKHYNGVEDEILYMSSDDIEIKNFSIEEGIVEAQGRKSIVVTLIVNTRDSNVELEDQIRQIVISTRNYQI